MDLNSSNSHPHLERKENVGELVPLQVSTEADHHAYKHRRVLLQALQFTPVYA